MIKDPCFPCSWGTIIICIHFLKLKVVFVDNIDENNNLNIFEIVASTTELVKEIVNCYWYFESIKSMQKTSIELWNGEGNINPCSQMWLFSWTNIRDYISSQVEIEKKFPLLITNSMQHYLYSYHLEKLIFASNNWPNNARVDCRAIFSLMELINSTIHFKKRN
jgi:hypothetical protein